MSKFILFGFLLFAQFASATTVPASVITTEQGNPILDAIAKALNSGDVNTLAQYFGSRVEISIADNEQTYDKAKAKDVLNGFFSSNKASGYAAMHSGKSKENSDQYSIGNLTTSGGTYRVYVYLKTEGTGMVIQEIRFDK